MRPKVFLDSKGLLMHMYYRGSDPSAIYVKEKDKHINTAGWGFSNMLEEYLIPILKDYHPSDIIAAWDGGDEYRTALFKNYKGKRKAAKKLMPAAEVQQIKLMEGALKSFLAFIGATNAYVDGVEADDLLAALCVAYEDHTKVIHTGDADMLQLANDKTVIFLKNEPVFMEHKGIPLNLTRLEKALCGDKSDEYIGVRGFGPKAWDYLVENFGHDGLQEIEQCIATKDYTLVEEVVADTGDKVLSRILEMRKDAELCYKLATLDPSVCYGFRGNKLIWPVYYTRVPNKKKVEHILNTMGFYEGREVFESLYPVETLVTQDNVHDTMNHFLEHLEFTPYVSFDYETTDELKNPLFNEAQPKTAKSDYLDVLSSKINGCSFNYGADLQYTIYLSIDHKDTDNVGLDMVELCISSVERKGIPLVAHNAAFEEQVTYTNLSYKLKKPYDTMIMSSYVNENEEAGLKKLSERLLAYAQASYKETLEAAGAKDMAGLTGEQVLSYGCDDSLVTAHLFKLFELVMRMEGTWQFYVDKERAPVHVLNHAFETGVNIDFEKVEVLHARSKKLIEENMIALREELALRCTGPDEAAAKRLDHADGDNLMALLKHRDTKHLTGDAIMAKRQALVLGWEAAAEYKPYTETYEPVQFIGTPTQLNLTLEGLGIDLEKLKISAVNNKQINIFITEAKTSEYIWKDGLNEFCVLLADALPHLKPSDRSGPEFAALASFCKPYLGQGKTVKEGDELNFNSPAQMRELIYCKLGVEIRRRTKVQRDSGRDTLGLDGSPSTDDKALKLAIAEDCQGENSWKADIIKKVMEVTEHQTLISLYYRPYPLWKHPRDGMIHPQVRNCGTVTRRPTGGSPNILQVKKGETRTVYLPRYEDHVIVAIDFSGQELRITGSEAKDPVMIDAYTGGGFETDEHGMVHPVTKDIHSVTAIAFAETIFKRELGTADFKFTYDQFREWLFCDDPELSAAANLCRKMAKVVNFLIIYGGQASTLAMGLGVPEKFAEELMRLVFATYSRLAPWQEETILYGRQHGFVKTAYGNLKHLTSDIRSKNGSLRSRQERQAVNQTVQGCAADILKEVLTTSYDTNLWAETDSVMIAPVYDEIVSSVPIHSVFEYSQRMQAAMNVTPPGHIIPMMAEVSVGPNWGAVQELGDNPSEFKLLECIEGFRGRIAA